MQESAARRERWLSSFRQRRARSPRTSASTPASFAPLPRDGHLRPYTPPMLGRAFRFLGVLVRALQLGGFLLRLTNAGWHPGAPVGGGRPLYLGIFSNTYLLRAVAGVFLFAALCNCVPFLQSLLGTAALPARDVLLWGAGELRKAVIRRRGSMSGR